MNRQYLPYKEFTTEFASWSDSFLWQLKLDFTLQDQKLSLQDQFEKFNMWRSKLCQIEKLRTGYIFAGLEFPHKHCHVVMLGRSAKTGRSLYNIDLGFYLRLWIHQTTWINSSSFRNSLLVANKIEIIESGFRASKYICENLIQYGGTEWFWKVSDERFLKKKEFKTVTS